VEQQLGRVFSLYAANAAGLILCHLVVSVLIRIIHAPIGSEHARFVFTVAAPQSATSFSVLLMLPRLTVFKIPISNYPIIQFPMKSQAAYLAISYKLCRR
jgi:hypothetical protein